MKNMSLFLFTCTISVSLNAMQSRQESNLLDLQKKLLTVREIQNNLYLLKYGAFAFDLTATSFAAKAIYSNSLEPDFTETVRSGITAVMFYIAGGTCHRLHKFLDKPIVQKISTLQATIDTLEKNRKITRRQTQ